MSGRWMFMFAMLLPLGLLPIGQVAGQEGGDPTCGNLETDCLELGESYHVFTQETPLNWLEWEDEGWHGACKKCTRGGQLVDAEECHPLSQQCEIGGSEEEQLAFSRLLGEARSGEVTRALAAAQAVPHRVAVNLGRQSLQIHDCTGAIIANLPLAKHLGTAMAMFPESIAVE